MQPPTLLRVFGCVWSPFQNRVHTIFNSAYQTGEQQRRSPSLFGVWGGAPAANEFMGIWVLMEPILEKRKHFQLGVSDWQAPKELPLDNALWSILV